MKPDTIVMMPIGDILPYSNNPRTHDGNEIFGGGALISDVKAEKVKAEKVKIKVNLSEREREIVDSLNQLDAPSE